MSDPNGSLSISPPVRSVRSGGDIVLVQVPGPAARIDIGGEWCESVEAALAVGVELPCHAVDPDLFFAENPLDIERAKSLCAECPVRVLCLDAALERREPWGVWGGEWFDGGQAIGRKRPRGRPRKDVAA